MMKVWILFKPPMLSSILWYHCGRAEGCHLVTARWRQKSRFPLRLHLHLKLASSVSLLDGGRSSRLPLPTYASLALWWGLLLTTGQRWKCSLSTPLTSPRGRELSTSLLCEGRSSGSPCGLGGVWMLCHSLTRVGVCAPHLAFDTWVEEW